MAFAEYRISYKKSRAYVFDIERFSYDVFAYMLRFCGFSETEIPATSLKENTYDEADLVKNVGLSALPICLYWRDEWRILFHQVNEQRINCKSDVHQWVESMLEIVVCDVDDFHSKIQLSLAFITEIALFLDLVGVEISFDCLLKHCCLLCKQHLEEIDMLDKTLESSFVMNPDISEPWIARFMKRFAIPYEKSNGVSKKFEFYVLKFQTGKDTNPKQMPVGETTHNQPGESASHPIGVSDESSEKLFGEVNCSLIGNLPGSSDQNQLEISEESFPMETEPYSRNTNGLNYVRRQCLKKRKRDSSEELGFEGDFLKMNFEKRQCFSSKP